MIKYNCSWLIQSLEAGKDIKFLYFWGHRPSKNGQITSSCFSQWWEAPFVVANTTYKTAEHWMMAQKALLFGDEQIHDKIVQSKSPGEAKALGRKVKNFDQAIWEKERYPIVVNGNLAKFQQHPDLKAFLLNTKERVLVEASPVDSIWGIGLAADDERASKPEKWEGLNLLGFALMETRDILRNP
ncbi:NADAR family protein [Adhaeribacter swui]|uniref:NADAR family protein n=1 Tax=Adhaeribacter swui TaxID=2086471 RepID=A0A7G7G927_9BACT|nr:NADAR family protein [Adhaeribacter swui]QNF33661.1 NADAR family protein [Adhaeribacter swui]